MNYNDNLTTPSPSLKGGELFVPSSKEEELKVPLLFKEGLGVVSELSITVIIPTYNGAKKVINCLHSLEKQTFQDFETIVVIDGSTDDTKAILETIKWLLKDFKVVFQENKGRACVRNTGVRHAKGDLLLFLDDDMRLEAKGVEKHLLHHQSIYNKNHINHNSNIKNIYNKTQYSFLIGNAIEDLTLVKTDIQAYRAYLSRKWANIGKKNIPLNQNNFFLMAANLSVPKQLLDFLGGFDEKLTDAEDYDLGKRALEQDYVIYFDNEIIGFHDDFITCVSYIKRQKQYKTSHLKLKELYPERYAQNQYIQKPAKGLKKLIYWLFSADFWVDMIDEKNIFKYNFLKVLPQKLRYKLYDVIIAAQAVHFPK